MTQISRFIEDCVSIAQRVTGERGESAAPEAGGGLTDYAYVPLHCLRIYFDTSYRMTMDLLNEMPQITREIGLEPDQDIVLAVRAGPPVVQDHRGSFP